jgi:hypothetical protein
MPLCFCLALKCGNISKGIAEYGLGEYFFIETADDIERIVHHAMQGMSDLVATNAILTVQGINGGVVQKVYGFTAEEITEGIKIGDLRTEKSLSLLV